MINIKSLCESTWFDILRPAGYPNVGVFPLNFQEKMANPLRFALLEFGFSLMSMLLFDCSPYISLLTGVFLFVLWTVQNVNRGKMAWEMMYFAVDAFFCEVSSRLEILSGKFDKVQRENEMVAGERLECRLAQLEAHQKNEQAKALQKDSAMICLRQRIDHLEHELEVQRSSERVTERHSDDVNARIATLQHEIAQQKAEKQLQLLQLWSQLNKQKRDIQDNEERFAKEQQQCRKEVDSESSTSEVEGEQNSNVPESFRTQLSDLAKEIKETAREVERTKIMVIDTEKTLCDTNLHLRLQLDEIQENQHEFGSRLDAVRVELFDALGSIEEASREPKKGLHSTAQIPVSWMGISKIPVVRLPRSMPHSYLGNLPYFR
eukprot:GEMP01055831.1.p1 GENE.GEMP01055831.1~~GEMP01055831.1.p1  ORF type:complete len:388 (+),score=71.55 GEMP01055831.1:36-1166(+)